ncbi:MAG: site-2 protease family protein, partial [Planctomycetota bacterium]|nr:site-2 protease family protein [Planctomycetota bacterium]
MHLMLIAAWYSPANWPYIAMALLALGFVIFVHELGHFLVAKLCGVKCEKFFVGFDVPIKLGWGKFAIQLPAALWRKTWGETEYGIGIIPLGGYVKMLGQDDNPGRQAEMMREAREQAEAGEPGGAAEATEENLVLDPRSYMAQTVPERMAIISAGVVMNIIFAWIFAAIAFGIGAPYTKCLVGFVTPGQVAWYNNVRPGNDIVKIGDIENPRFKDMRQEVILGDHETGIPLVVRRKSEKGEMEDVDFVLKPRADSVARYNVPILGVSPTSTLALATENSALPSSPAAAIEGALEGNETIVEVDGQPVETFAEYITLLARKADQEIAVTLVKKPSATTAESAVKTIERVTVNVAANRLRRFGLVMAISAITAVQPGSPAAEAGIQVDDELVAIDGQPVGDPLLLPAYFRRRAGQPVEIELLRPSQGGSDKQSVRVVVTPREPEWYAVLRETLEVPALGIVYDVSPEVAAIVPESPAAASEIRVGDQIVKANLIPAGDEQKQLELEVFGSLSALPIGGKTGSSWPGF